MERGRHAGEPSWRRAYAFLDGIAKSSHPESVGAKGKIKHKGERPPTTKERTSPEARARAYVFSTGFPASIAGQKGHSVLYRVACILVDGFGLTREQAMPIFRDWNRDKADPPESESQINHKMDDAIKNHGVPSLNLLNTDRLGYKRYGSTPSANGDAGRNGTPSGNERHGDGEPSRFPFTDTGNAERMIALHGHNIRHCHPWKKWLHFDGRRWAPDDTAAIRRMAKKTARSILVEASEVDDKTEREMFIKWARATESAKNLNAMIGLASSEEGVPVVPRELDQHPWLLNVQNGTIDLRTGKLRPHRREDLITALAPSRVPS